MMPVDTHTPTHPFAIMYLMFYQFLCAVLLIFEVDNARAWSIWFFALCGLFINYIVNYKKFNENIKTILKELKAGIKEFFGR